MLRGGSELTIAGNGVGEPMNVGHILCIESLSFFSAPVLTDDGFLGWARAIGYDEECLDINLGAPQQANLGDGNGTLNQTAEFRASFNLPIIGTCLEGLTGGGHFRYWRQDGPLANTGALFLAVSQEEGLLTGQTIAPDGYNVGRDAFVAAASGSVSSGGITYTTIAQNITCLLLAGSSGINQGRSKSH
ncbi:hypothetical protein PUNSTDRAFT_131529 [Punctularia strigosozonata HHB-11173 SS5]|uniref:uncharacterized protein n=1 Tax=Punctularia strigosozonata (strain HHB-11173) TaxID=741275 RepID=UPI0004417470|nr:uncharacterized protein PUNSTDRAFT_131529 [Punctularia strigosozonata HHB-11173 SS5]EIN11367.1 hypothetical protein PUNSTDRAFT_131529 [Punctularia strigosozonata HHB-11173 SS5]